MVDASGRLSGVPTRPLGVRGFMTAAVLYCAIYFAMRLDSRAASAPDAAADSAARVLLVLGAGGTPEYEATFHAELKAWQEAARVARASVGVVGDDAAAAGANDHDRLQQLLAAEPKDGTRELWLVLIGHGSFDGQEAKFNLRGPDLSANELAAWLKPFHRPLAFINTASASAPFLGKISAPGRVIVTATRSGNETNYTRFGQFFAAALTDPKSDLDQDGQTSLLEAFLFAASRVAEFYTAEGRLATEHALIDDNGDGLGTPAEWFRGTRATKRAKDGAALDGARARQFHLVRSAGDLQLSPAQRARRDDLEVALEALRETKAKTPEAEYYRKLESLLLELARIYESPPAG